MKTDPRRLDTFGRIAIALVVTGFTLMIIHLAVRPIYAARGDLSAFQEAVQILSDAEGNLDKLDAEIGRISQDVEKSHAQLPRSVNLDVFLEWVGEIAAQTGVRVERLSPGEPEHQALYRRLHITARIVGRFEGIYDFLIALEQADQLSRVEQLSIVGAPEQIYSAADLTIALYFAPNEEDK